VVYIFNDDKNIFNYINLIMAIYIIMLSKQFIRAKIEQEAGVYVLTITYRWYFLYDWEIKYVCESIEDAKSKLIKERTNDHLSVIGKEGNELNI
jgi:hypothetical protein